MSIKGSGSDNLFSYISPIAVQLSTQIKYSRMDNEINITFTRKIPVMNNPNKAQTDNISSDDIEYSNNLNDIRNLIFAWKLRAISTKQSWCHKGTIGTHDIFYI